MKNIDTKERVVKESHYMEKWHTYLSCPQHRLHPILSPPKSIFKLALSHFDIFTPPNLGSEVEDQRKIIPGIKLHFPHHGVSHLPYSGKQKQGKFSSLRICSRQSSLPTGKMAFVCGNVLG